MKRVVVMAGLAVCATALFGADACCAAAGAADSLTEQEKQDGWRLLWDGKTGEGWPQHPRMTVFRRRDGRWRTAY